MDYISGIGPTLFIITAVISIGYVLLISKIWTYWDDMKEWSPPYQFQPTTFVTVIVCARNEEKSMLSCISSILQNIFPHEMMEVIVIDDGSTDRTIEILSNINDPRLRVYKNNGTGKKAAITQAVGLANGSFILATDADCIVPKKWISTFVSYYEISNARLITGPVRYMTDRSLIQRFQYLDALNNIALTGSGIHSKEYYLANGANMAYEKSLFQEIGGFKHNDHLASGDDMFLIQEAAKIDRSKVRYLKSRMAMVDTEPLKSWKALIAQRKRWATKSNAFKSEGIFKIQRSVFMFVVFIFFHVLLLLFGIHISLFSIMFGLLLKWSIDYLYLSRMADFAENRRPLKSFIPASVIFMCYILMAGYWAMLPSTYRWKGRNVQ